MVYLVRWFVGSIRRPIEALMVSDSPFKWRSWDFEWVARDCENSDLNHINRTWDPFGIRGVSKLKSLLPATWAHCPLIVDTVRFVLWFSIYFSSNNFSMYQRCRWVCSRPLHEIPFKFYPFFSLSSTKYA